MNAELKLIMQTKTTHNVKLKSEAEFLVKGSKLSPQDSSRLRVEVPLWLSWLNTNVNKQSQSKIQLSTNKYQAYKDKSNMNMQDIKHKWVKREREMSNHKHEKFVLRFKTLALRGLHRNEGFSL